MQQLKSWFDPTGTPASQVWGKDIIAQFFFPTDKSDLDFHDLWVINKLAAHLRNALMRDRVELAIVGFADYRGSSGYNKELGMRRARSVARMLNRLLRSEPLFSSFSALAQGERYAVQGTQDESVLARDRCVSVWSSTGYLGTPSLPPLQREPQLLRMVYRHFGDIKPQSTLAANTGGGDAVNDGIAALGDLIKSAIFDQRVGKWKIQGNEDMRSRQYKHFNASDRVNRIDIDFVHKYEVFFGGEMDSFLTDVKYDWGKPQPYLTVNYSSEFRLFGKPDKTPFRETVRISRAQADKEPFFFPPPLFSTPE